VRRWISWIDAWRAYRDPDLPTWARWLPVVALAYGLSPIDFIPDIFPIVGWLDDLGVGATTLALTMTAVLRHAEALRKGRGTPV
jgi:uncharacterized membrane protein YkvA (DUF1232 family)